MPHGRSNGGVVQGAGGAILGLFVMCEVALLLIGVLFGLIEMFVRWTLKAWD